MYENIWIKDMEWNKPEKLGKRLDGAIGMIEFLTMPSPMPLGCGSLEPRYNSPSTVGYRTQGYRPTAMHRVLAKNRNLRMECYN
jgi:hypothetical protein